MNSHVSILLVDDDSFVLESTARLLNALGYSDVHAVPGPEEARHHFWQGPSAVDLLISDLQMPGSNGDEVAAEFIRAQPDLKVIFLSGMNPDTYASKIRLERGVNFLSKPYRAMELKHAIESCLAFQALPA